ncbi:MAG: hypothetical protein PHS44_04675 [Candidatus Dojkabacteria bacterium]|nr:hypothetical protein [Candidatus Dojkabacteria bacterium]
MNDYNQRRRPDSRRRFGNRDTVMFEAVCDECGNNCQVPFKPSGNKPVYCSRCVEKQSGGQPRGPRDRNFDRRRDYGDKQMFTAVCDECGEECEVPFRPTSGKSVYCDRCFKKTDKSDKRSSGGNSGDKELTNQMQKLNSKMDTMIERLNALLPLKNTTSKPVSSKKKSEEAKLVIKKITEKKTGKDKTKTKKAVAKKTAKPKTAKTVKKKTSGKKQDKPAKGKSQKKKK